VKNYARPGGNITGFTAFEAEVGGKWLDVLKEIASRGPLLSETPAYVALSHWGRGSRYALVHQGESVGRSRC
jgi:hypothetical protein